MCRRFGTLCLFVLHKWYKLILPIKKEWTKCSEKSAHKIQTLRNHPKGSIKRSEHGGSLKSGRQILADFECNKIHKKIITGVIFFLEMCMK
jgi:hypothetical protein